MILCVLSMCIGNSHLSQQSPTFLNGKILEHPNSGIKLKNLVSSSPLSICGSRFHYRMLDMCNNLDWNYGLFCGVINRVIGLGWHITAILTYHSPARPTLLLQTPGSRIPRQRISPSQSAQVHRCRDPRGGKNSVSIVSSSVQYVSLKQNISKLTSSPP